MESMSAELRLLLTSTKVVISAEDRASIRRQLTENVDWTRLAKKSLDSGLAPLIGLGLASTAPDLVPPDLLEAFEIAAVKIRQKNLALFEELATIVEVLAKRRGIHVIPLGGPALTIRTRGNLDFCASTCLDFAVKESELRQANAILRDLGYGHADLPTSLAQASAIAGGTPMRKEANGPIIKLHTRFAPVTFSSEIDEAAFWRRAQHTPLAGQSLLTLRAEDELLLLAVQGANNFWWNLGWASDLAAFIVSGPTIDAAELLQRALAQRCRRALVLAMALTRRSFGIELPSPVYAAERSDGTIGPMVARIIGHWETSHTARPSGRVLISERLRLQDSFASRSRYIAQTLFGRPTGGADSTSGAPLNSSYRLLKSARHLIVGPPGKVIRRAVAQTKVCREWLASSEFCSAILPLSAEQKHYQRARAHAENTLASHPKDFASWEMLGDAQFGLKRYKKALGCYERAIALDQEQSSIWFKRSRALEAMRLRADHPFDVSTLQQSSAFAVKANHLWSLRRFEEAADASNRALEADPNNRSAARVGIEARLMACDWSRWEEDNRRVAEGLRTGEMVTAPFAHRCMRDSESESLALAQSWTRKVRQGTPLWRGEIYLHEKIRVAYVSPDLRQHPVPDVMAGCFELHDRTIFETTAVSVGPNDGSKMRRRLEAAFDRFIDAEGMATDRVAELMRDLEIDIAVDLYGSPDAPHGQIFTRRPAPLQVNYLGHPGTKGAFLDYIIADPTLIPSSNRKFYSEQVAYLPHTYMPTDQKRAVSPKLPSRSEAGLPDEAFVFACHHPATKIGPELFDVWARLLAAVNGSILWLRAKRSQVVINLRREMRARGVAPERLVFAPHMPDASDHLARLSLADLFLDALPYNAHSSGCDALLAGLPVVTCLGNAFPGRVGASMLYAVGLPELVTTSLPEYEELARTLAQEPEQLARLRTKLSGNRKVEPLFDTPRFTRHLERAYKMMHERQQAGLAPESISVPAQ